MAGRTISSSISGPVQLAETDNPLTVTTAGTVTATNANALETAGTADWVIGNAGTIMATGTAGIGIQMNSGLGSAGGTITNAATGRIEGVSYGINSLKPSVVTNAGTIAASADGVGVRIGTGTITNNGASALITGGYAVYLPAGGTLNNQVGGQVAGQIIGAAVAGTIASSISNAGSVSGRFGVLSVNPATTVTNSGSIQATGKFIQNVTPPESVGSGVQLRNGGTIVNTIDGTINGFWIGAQIGSFNSANATASAVLNAGTILANDPGKSGAAVWFKGNGQINNTSTGRIGDGPYGIVTYDTVTITNAGSIAGDKGVLFKGLGQIVNQAGGVIGGGSRGITTYQQVTIANHGQIAGSQYAVFTDQSGKASRIITYPGASFSGTVLGDKAGVATPTGVLELAVGGATGTITGFGSKYLGFGRVEVDPGASWSLAGTVAAGQTISLSVGAALTLANPGSVSGVITGFDADSQLVLGGVTDVTGAVLGANNVLTVSRSAGDPIVLKLDPAQSFPSNSFSFAGGAGGTTLTAPCFAQGTRIATDRGEVAVEALAAGMQVRLARGGTAEIAWVGHRRVECRRHPRPQEVWPVRVAAGAFGRGLPCRDLLLSPDHAVFVSQGPGAGMLIPVRHLVNGRTVRQEKIDSITYFHVELAAHDVLLAEGLPCESYLDTGNRAAFANAGAHGGGAMMLHADFARRSWSAAGCAPLVETGPEVAALRARLLARAGALGHRRSPDPDVAVLADGRALPMHRNGRWRDVALPPDVRAVAVSSRAWVPADMDSVSDDTRQLGVAVARLALDGTPVPPADARFGTGWHAPEPDWRWTNGLGWLHTHGARHLSFEIAAAGLYWLPAPEAAAG